MPHPGSCPGSSTRQTRTLIDTHRAAGDLLVIASSTPSDLAVPIARQLGADVAIATTACLTADGRYSGGLEFLCHGPAKAAAVRRVCTRMGVGLGASSAYSDSIVDLPLLTAVGNPVATNPEPALAAVARHRGWRILQLS
ncbi:MAG: HAD family hydrolase [Acidimicrobiales bacterium]